MQRETPEWHADRDALFKKADALLRDLELQKYYINSVKFLNEEEYRRLNPSTHDALSKDKKWHDQLEFLPLVEIQQRLATQQKELQV